MAEISNKFGSTRVRSVEIVRPADVLGYVAGDVVGTAVTDTATTPLLAVNLLRTGATSPIIRVTGGSGYIVGVRVTTDQVGCVAAWRVHVYKKANGFAVALPGDNVPMTMSYANLADRICSIDLPAMKTSTVTGTSTAAATENIDIRRYLSLAGYDIADLYIRLETLTAFTPASGQKFDVELAVEDN